MKASEEYTNDLLAKIKEINKEINLLVITESNVIDLYKELSGKKVVDQEEIDEVKKRFKELCNYGR